MNKYVDLLKDYIQTQWKWILTFIVFTQIDLLLTKICISNNMGSEGNPFVYTQVMGLDVGFDFIRDGLIIFLIMTIALSNTNFTRLWVLQSITVGYTLVLLNNVVIIIHAILTHYTETPQEPMPYVLHLLIIVIIFVVGFFSLYILRKYALKQRLTLKEVFK